MRTWFDRIQRWLGAPAEGDAALDAAERRAVTMVTPLLRTRQGRRFRSRLRGKDVPADDVFLSVVTNLVLMMQGGETTEDGLAEVLEAGGANLRELVKASTIEDLLYARDLINLFVPFASALAVMIRTMFRLPDAMGFGVLADMADEGDMLGYAVPLMLLLRDVTSTPEALGLLAMMREKLVPFQQAASFLTTVPEPIARRLAQGDTEALDGLDADERRRVQEEATRLLAQN